MIAVIGEALVDLVISPEGRVEATLGGAPYNTACALGRLDVPTRYVGAVSEDRFGRLLLDRLEADGVELGAVQRTPRPTTLAAAEIDEAGGASYRFYLADTSVPSLSWSTIAAGVTGVDACFTGGLALVVEPMADAVIDAVASLADRVLVAVDVNCRPAVIPDRAAYLGRLDRILPRADLVKVSDEDLAYLEPDVASIDAARRLLARGPRAVVVTGGGSGATVLDDVTTVEVPTGRPAGPVVDTIGAGDTFIAGVLAWWVSRGLGPDDLDAATLARATAAGHAAAAVVVTRRGADPPRRDELPDDWA